MNSVIELENVTKIFTNTQGIIRRKKKRVYALHDVNLSIGEKEILGLIGESGSGKTTLGLAVLRLLDLRGVGYFSRVKIFSAWTKERYLNLGKRPK
jgi:ABC-type oligopeptide transport system, ATPase component